MFLLMIGIPHSSFGITSTLSAGKGQTSKTQRIQQEPLEQLMQFHHGKDEELLMGSAISYRDSHEHLFAPLSEQGDSIFQIK